MSKATEVMMQYVENLKRTYEKDHAELTEFKKLANQNSNRSYGGSVETGGEKGCDAVCRPSYRQRCHPGLAINLTVSQQMSLFARVDDGVPRPSRSMSLTLGKVNT